MALKKSDAVRNASLDAHEVAIGASPFLQIRSGAVPANCAAAASGTLLAEIALPSDWLANAAGGVKSKSGTWQDLSADATGVATYFRVLDNSKATCHLQGTVGTSGADMIVDNANFTAGQGFTVNNFAITASGA